MRKSHVPNTKQFARAGIRSLQGTGGVNHKERLYELGGTLPDRFLKWDRKKAAEEAAGAGSSHP